VIVGVPRERKVHEHRVGVVPSGVHALAAAGHHVLLERGAGLGSGLPDAAYAVAGAEIVDDPAAVWARSDLVVKVMEPEPSEYARMEEGQILFTFLHLAAIPALAAALLERRVTAIAYETIQHADDTLPVLRPMSEVAGRMAPQIGAACLEKSRGGKGVLLGGVPGVQRGRVVVVGAGTVGLHAVRVAAGLGAGVVLLDRNPARLALADDLFDGRVQTLFSDVHTVAAEVRGADLLIGAVLVPGARAPKVISEEMVASMAEGSVVVDVAVDQGGCVETTHPTTHDAPTFLRHGVVHYGVPNIPGAVARTSTFALASATIGFVVALADRGVAAAVDDRALARGVNTLGGHVTHQAVARAVGADWVPLEAALASAPRPVRRRGPAPIPR
jgi:alanine dehydrogenase